MVMAKTPFKATVRAAQRKLPAVVRKEGFIFICFLIPQKSRARKAPPKIPKRAPKPQRNGVSR